MKAAPEVDQVVIEQTDERVRCGNAIFTPFLSELEVQFSWEGGECETVKYDLRSVPYNEACQLYDESGRPTNHLICNQWGTLHVRYGEIPANKHFVALTAKKLPREVRLADDLLRSPKYSSSAMHPNPRIPFLVRVLYDKVTIELLDGGLTADRYELTLKDIPAGRWHTPKDRHGRKLPVMVCRPIVAALAGLRMIDIQWVG